MLLSDKIKIHPNPVSSKLFIEQLKNKSEYKIFDATGKQISFGNLSKANKAIDISNLKTGFYILNLKQNKKTFNFKFLKKI